MFFVCHSRCLCSLNKLAGKGASLVEYLIQVFFKRLDGLGIENKQVIEICRLFDLIIFELLFWTVDFSCNSHYVSASFMHTWLE